MRKLFIGWKNSLRTGAQQGIWDESAGPNQIKRPRSNHGFGLDAPLPLPAPRAAVVFDGLLVARRLPLLLKLAEESGLRVKSALASSHLSPYRND